MIPLSTFPPALARLLLCGGGGLPAAWGPLFDARDQMWPWDAARRHVLQYDDRPAGLIHWRSHPFSAPTGWSLPLEASPWPARMAVVAAWMLELQKGAPLGGRIFRRTEIEGFQATRLHLFRWDAPYTIRWLPDGSAEFTRDDGRRWCRWPALNLPTLPTHLTLYPPEVALLLALYDVPEIKARVEALYAT